MEGTGIRQVLGGSKVDGGWLDGWMEDGRIEGWRMDGWKLGRGSIYGQREGGREGHCSSVRQLFGDWRLWEGGSMEEGGQASKWA